MGIAERLLKALGLSPGLRIGAVVLLGAAAAAAAVFLVLLCLCEMLVAGLYILPWLFGQRRMFWLIIGGLCLGGVWALLLGLLVVGGRSSDAPPGSSSDVAYTRKIAKEASVADETEGKPKLPAPSYQGLPPRETIPWGAQRNHFHGERLASAGRPVQVVMLWRPAVQLVGTACFSLAMLFLALRGGLLRMGVKTRWRRVLEAKAASESPSA